MTPGHAGPIPAAPVALSTGSEMPSETLGPLTRTDFVRYAGAGGDLNPIHHDEPAAVEAGMPSVFGMGMFHAGVIGLRLARWVGPNNIRSLTYRFTGQVWPGDRLTLTGVVTEVSGTEASVSLTVARQNGEVVLRATAAVTVGSRIEADAQAACL